MFLGREKELKELSAALSDGKHKTAVLVYGKRRVGKSTLINEAARSFRGAVINHLCVTSTYEGNMELIYRNVREMLELPGISFDSIFSMMEYLGTLEQNVLLILDEYPYLKQTRKKGEVDSIMQVVIDRLPKNVKIILCGSYITIMKELLEESNPLFGRFTLIQHIRDFDYYDAARFYPEQTARDKIAYYAVFGGSPYVLEQLDPTASLRDNILKLLLPETGIVRTHIENVMLREIQKSYDIRILEALGNGKKRYSEIKEMLKISDTGLLDKQLKVLLNMETIQKSEPINRRNDRKKQFYEITDNLMRFYFTFVFAKAGMISRIGSDQFAKRNIDDKIEQFISRRMEGMVIQYFHRAALNGGIPDIEDFGSYWYDDPVTKTNGEFDCVIKRVGDIFDFYECKYFDREMTLEECRQEEAQLASIKGIQPSGIGFVCSGGFSFEDEENYQLITGDELYR